MGTPGVPFDIPREHIVETIKKKKGVVMQILQSLDIAYDTYAEHIKSDPELKKILDRARNDYDEHICDLSETVLMKALNQDDLGHALGSAKFVLNNKGRSRGYSPINSQEPQSNAEALKPMNDFFKTLGEAGRAACEKVLEKKIAQHPEESVNLH